ncbi:MAG TPA: hypothetical protein QF753_16735 [Victivallales bacterium]|nr:hypothetical protein [Victivallales bacterium]
MNKSHELIFYLSVCIVTILAIIAILVFNILIGCEIIFDVNKYVHSYVFHILRIIKWIGMWCLLFFYIKEFLNGYRIRIIKKSCIAFILIFICYLVIYCPLHLFTFSSGADLNMTVWILLDFIAVILMLVSISYIYTYTSKN